MLHERTPPPSSSAVASSNGPRPVSRRNSFSRDMVVSIAQSRATTTGEARLGETIGLHVKDAMRPVSPRKSASFTRPKMPRQDDGLGYRDRARVLRSTLSDAQLGRQVDNDNPVPARSLSSSLGPQTRNTAIDDRDELVIDVGESIRTDHDVASSASSSSYSPVSPARDDDDDDDVSPTENDPDAFEMWLEEARMLELSTTSRREDNLTEPPRLIHSVDSGESSEIPEWLVRDRAPSLELSKSVQQIEHEIRLAIDSAASRVNDEAERRELLARELDDRTAPPTSSSPDVSTPLKANSLLSSTVEPELLLLMEVLIGDGRSETIEVHVGDRPEHLAAAFAAKHGLVADAIPRLSQHIQDQLNALTDEEGVEGDTQDTQPQAEGERVSSEAEFVGDSIDADSRDNRSPFDEGQDVDRPLPPPNPPFEFPPPQQQREYEREHSYNHLMEKYGHYTSHTNKVDPTAPHLPTNRSNLTLHRQEEPSDPLTLRNVELSEHARLRFTPRPVAFSSKATSKDKESVYNRLYALAEAREKWIRRQQKAKAADEVRERQAMTKLEISAKSRVMVASRGSGGYAHIGERLYDEALSDMAKKEREREKRQRERAEEIDWTCPKCAFVNQHINSMCKNVVAAPPPAPASFTMDTSRRETLVTTALVDTYPEVVCGHPRPEELFRPTLLVAPTSATRAVQHHKLRTTATAASSQRQRTQQQMEDEFRQTCPFKPKINDVSEEIMRDKLEQEAKAGAGPGGGIVTTATGEVRRKNPHIALYEDAFHARAQREAREEAHLKQFPFKPNIGVNALWSKSTGDDADVVERLAVSKYRELEQKRLSLHAKYAPDRDPITGREYFKPETGRAPIFNRNERGLPIGDFLYEAHKEQEEYLRRLRQQEDELRKQRSEQTFVSDKSKQALEVRKKKTFARLFDWLVKSQQTPQQPDPSDDKEEPRLIPSALDTSTLSPDIARIASIVMEFAQHEPFTFDAFEGYMEKLMHDMPGLTYTQVLFVTESLNDGKNARQTMDRSDSNEVVNDPELTFRPTIDKNSDALAKKHGRADRPNVFEALSQYYDHYKDRQAQAKKQREREFARTHPFQPTFVSKDRHTKAAKFYDKLHHQEMTTSIGVSSTFSAKDTTPPLCTAVPNARPFVRPLGRTPSDQTLRSRTSSGAGEDEDAVLTSHVLAALGDGVATPVGGPQTTSPEINGSTLGVLFYPATATNLQQ